MRTTSDLSPEDTLQPRARKDRAVGDRATDPQGPRERRQSPLQAHGASRRKETGEPLVCAPPAEAKGGLPGQAGLAEATRSPADTLPTDTGPEKIQKKITVPIHSAILRPGIYPKKEKAVSTEVARVVYTETATEDRAGRQSCVRLAARPLQTFRRLRTPQPAEHRRAPGAPRCL